MLKTLAAIAIFIVAALHGGFAYLEMALWETDAGRSITDYSAADAALTSVLAANQGLYNLFLAAGLFWGLLTDKRDVQVFFLLCVVVAGLYGWHTADSTTILALQAAPGAFALLLRLLTLREV